MDMLIKVLIALSGLAFLLAILSIPTTGGMIFNVPAEGFSRACSNLALLAIALAVVPKQSSGTM